MRWVEELIEAEPRIAGIVAFVDLLEESSRDWALAHISGLPHVVGVRHNIQHHRTGFRGRRLPGGQLQVTGPMQEQAWRAPVKPVPSAAPMNPAEEKLAAIWKSP